MVALGASVLHQTARALRAPRAVGKALWLLGAAVVLARFSTGALAHWGLMLSRNQRRKRQLLRRLEVVEVRGRGPLALCFCGTLARLPAIDPRRPLTLPACPPSLPTGARAHHGRAAVLGRAPADAATPRA